MKKPIIIRFEGSNDIIVWKHTCRDFGYNTEIEVPFSHEVLFVKDGVVLETLDSGTHTLNEKSKGMFGGVFKNKKNQFSCSVYFVNKTVEKRIPWGTPNQIDVFDALLNIPVRIGAHGEVSISVSNSRKLLSKLVGMSNNITTDEIANFVRSKLILLIKDLLANTMVEEKVSFYDLSTKQVGISKALKERLNNTFDEYGIEVKDFVLESVVINDSVRDEVEKAYLSRQVEVIKNQNSQVETQVDKKQFCCHCGKNIDIEGDKCYCVECGKQITKNSKYCSYCGKKQ